MERLPGLGAAWAGSLTYTAPGQVWHIASSSWIRKNSAEIRAKLNSRESSYVSSLAGLGIERHEFFDLPCRCDMRAVAFPVFSLPCRYFCFASTSNSSSLKRTPRM